MSGTKNDHGKPRWSLLPWRSMEQVVRVLEHGADRYGDDNWRHVTDAENRYFSAMIRHAITPGADPESGLSHRAHAVANALFLLELENEEKNHKMD